MNIRYLIFFLSFIVGLLAGAKLAHADEGLNEVKPTYYMTGALGVFDSGRHSLTEEKFLNIGRRTTLGPFIQQVEIGGWTDVAGNSRSGSAYGAYQVGLEVDGAFLGRICTGPAFISSPDVYLGGHFQFTEDFYIGEHDAKGHSVGFIYKHISSAGLEEPNIGRDQMGFQIGLPF